MAMHRSLTTATTAALCLLLAPTSFALMRPGASDTIETARQRLGRDDPRGAVALLEGALLDAADKDRAALVEQLRAAYSAAIKKAEAEGKKSEADTYRDDLEILTRKPRKDSGTPAPAKQIEPPGGETKPERRPARVSEPDAQPTRPLATAEPVAPLRLPTDAGPRSESTDLPAAKGGLLTRDDPALDREVKPSALPGDEPKHEPTPTASVAEADAAFVAKHYEQAGRLYAELDRAKGLPADRRDHWAYCRSADVVRRINARPTAQQEWDSIDAEIEAIRALNPKSWFAEYLRKCVAERKAAVRPKLASNPMVVRGSSPDEPATPRPTRPADLSPVDTPNFRIIHSDRALAERIAREAESARTAQVKRWMAGGPPATAWSPKCEVHVYATAAAFSRETGQRPESPGFSTISMGDGRVVARRINLRADHANVVDAVLPHEVTHVVLADLFPTEQIPRWADEGMAVLAEPAKEQALRAADLEQPLASGRVFPVDKLVSMDYPQDESWSLYYAQSVSLTRFLVESGSPDRFVKFVRLAQQSGAEPAVRSVYGIRDFGELHERWVEYARSHASGTLAASSETADQDATRARR
jgi:hypothetical protein